MRTTLFAIERRFMTHHHCKRFKNHGFDHHSQGWMNHLENGEGSISIQFRFWFRNLKLIQLSALCSVDGSIPPSIDESRFTSNHKFSQNRFYDFRMKAKNQKRIIHHPEYPKNHPETKRRQYSITFRFKSIDYNRFMVFDHCHKSIIWQFLSSIQFPNVVNWLFSHWWKIAVSPSETKMK